jgi:hypothetical protein
VIYKRYFEEWCGNIVEKDSKKHIFTGDFNIDVSKHEYYSKKLLEIARQNNMHQKVNEYTSETHTSKTIIDLVFTDNDNVECKVDKINNISDHNMINISYKFRNENNKNDDHNMSEIWCWTNYTREKMVSALFECDWNNYDNCETVDRKENYIHKILQDNLTKLIFKKK